MVLREVFVAGGLVKWRFFESPPQVGMSPPVFLEGRERFFFGSTLSIFEVPTV